MTSFLEVELSMGQVGIVVVTICSTAMSLYLKILYKVLVRP